MKTCIKCHQLKLLKEFSSHKKYKDGKHSWCRKCKNLAIKRCRKKYPWKVAFQHIKTRCNNPKYKQYKNYGGRGIKSFITEEELKFLWFRDKAYEMKIPTIDREDNDGNYIFENCRYIEKSLNSKKDKYKPINQYTLEGSFVRSWNSMIEVEHVTGFIRQNISKCCLGKAKTANDYKWKYAGKDNK